MHTRVLEYHSLDERVAVHDGLDLAYRFDHLQVGEPPEVGAHLHENARRGSAFNSYTGLSRRK